MKKFLKAYSPHDKHGYLINIEQIVSVLDTDEHDVTVFMTDGKEYCLLEIDTPEDLNKLLQQNKFVITEMEVKMDNKKLPKFNLGDEFYINQAVPSLTDPLRMMVFEGNYRVTKIDNEPNEETIFYHLTQSCGGHTIRVIEDILEKSEKKG